MHRADGRIGLGGNANAARKAALSAACSDSSLTHYVTVRTDRAAILVAVFTASKGIELELRCPWLLERPRLGLPRFFVTSFLRVSAISEAFSQPSDNPMVCSRPHLGAD
jgi:hypothetical protein